jgi:hypothetical protein
MSHKDSNFFDSNGLINKIGKSSVILRYLDFILTAK